MKFPGIGVICSFVASLSVVAGCASMVAAVLEAPKVHPHSVRVKDSTGDGAVAVIALSVENPNGVDLTVDRLDYVLSIGGRAISSAQIQDPANIKARATTVVEIPVPFKYSEVFVSVLDLLRTGTAVYKVTGEAKIGIFTLPFDQSGDLKLRN